MYPNAIVMTGVMTVIKAATVEPQHDSEESEKSESMGREGTGETQNAHESTEKEEGETERRINKEI
jgi:hypothetical protein